MKVPEASIFQKVQEAASDAITHTCTTCEWYEKLKNVLHSLKCA
jgi:hypothetical protein